MTTTPTTTETGIDYTKYIEERDKGTIALLKGAPASGNYILTRTTFGISVVNGTPTIVEGTPQLKNINRQSLADIRALLLEEEATIISRRAQLDAIEADMNLRDTGK